MSLQDNLKNVKKELSTEESFLENFFKLESFYKKYKIAIIASGVAIVIGIIGIYTFSYFEEQKKIEVNKAFSTVLKDPSNQTALDTLQEKNKDLYQIALMMQNKKEKTNNRFLNQLVAYTKALEEGNIEKLTTLTQNQDFLLKDFALLNKAILETKAQKYTQAKASLALIPKDSAIQSLAEMLDHHLMTK